MPSMAPEDGQHRQLDQHLPRPRPPPNHAHRIEGLLRYTQHYGQWPGILTSLEQLMGLLQQHPTTHRLPSPPGPRRPDRRIHRSDRHRPPHPPQPKTDHRAGPAVWERFTGRDIAYAPESLRLGPASPAYTALRRQLAVRDADLFHAAHRQLQTVPAADRTRNVDTVRDCRVGGA
jgi:hypothetical protein